MVTQKLEYMFPVGHFVLHSLSYVLAGNINRVQLSQPCLTVHSCESAMNSWAFGQRQTTHDCQYVVTFVYPSFGPVTLNLTQ